MDSGKRRKYTKKPNRKTTLLSITRGVFAHEFKIKLFSLKTLASILVIGVFYAISALYFYALKDLPSPDSLAKYDPKQTTTIYDRKGNVLYRIYSDEDRTIAKIDEIPQDVTNATLLDKDLEGGSTITQQLVKNTLLSPERTWERKIKEAILAVEVERKFSKSQILEMYLNRIPYGGTSYGIRAAAKRYFGKELNELSLSESAYLAGLPA